MPLKSAQRPRPTGAGSSVATRSVRTWCAEHLGRRSGPVPTRDQVTDNAMRQVAGIALVVLAATIVHATGHVDQQWQYVAIAAALVPQVLVDVLAARDPERRARLRACRRPAWVPLGVGAVLAVVVPGAVLAGDGATAAGALSAAVGLGVAAAPVTVRPASGPRSSGQR